MAFRASNIIPLSAYQTVKRAAAQLKASAQGVRAQLAASNASYDFLRDIYRTLERAQAQFTQLAATPGLADYAKAQENDPAYDVAAEFTAMQSAITATLTWMNNNVPTSVTAKPPANWGDGALIATEFTPAQTAGLRAQLDAVIATID